MRHATMYAVAVISSLLIVCSAICSSAQDKIIILGYSLRPVGYVSSGKFVETAWNVELNNTAGEPLSFVMKFKFIDKDKKQLIEAKEKCKMEANERRKYSGKILLKSSVAEKVSSTRLSIEDVH